LNYWLVWYVNHRCLFGIFDKISFFLKMGHRLLCQVFIANHFEYQTSKNMLIWGNRYSEVLIQILSALNLLVCQSHKTKTSKHWLFLKIRGFKEKLKHVKKATSVGPGLGPINKNSQIREIFRKSQKFLNPLFLSEKLKNLSRWCFGLAGSLEG
jgi:hypothetical protein